MGNRFKGKVAMVTGAAHGLGAAHALAFAREGADVVVSDIAADLPDAGYRMGDEDEVNEVCAQIRDMGCRALGIKCDVTKAADVKAMVDKTIEEFGQIDILVNNAGIVIMAQPLWEISEESWDVMINVMFKGTFLCCKYVLPHMIERKYGKIVNTSSIGSRGQKHNVPYSSVKAGLNAFTLTTAKDAGEYNINVNAVAPGCVNTPMMDGACKQAAKDFGMEADELYPALCRQFHILGQEILAEDISNAVLFLCSEEARNVNGHVLFVDGGFQAI